MPTVKGRNGHGNSSFGGDEASMPPVCNTALSVEMGIAAVSLFWQSWLKHVCLATKLFLNFSENVQFQTKGQKCLLLQNEQKSMVFFHLISVTTNLNTKSSLNPPPSFMLLNMFFAKKCYYIIMSNIFLELFLL